MESRGGCRTERTGARDPSIIRSSCDCASDLTRNRHLCFDICTICQKRRLFLLTLPLFAERAFPLGHVGGISGWIDERVGAAAGLESLVFGLQPEVGAVGAQKQVD